MFQFDTRNYESEDVNSSQSNSRKSGEIYVDECEPLIQCLSTGDGRDIAEKDRNDEWDQCQLYRRFLKMKGV